MSANTSIEWTSTINQDGTVTKGATWNPVRGCALVSHGCTNCYAMKVAHRFSGPGGTYEGLTKMTSHGPVWTGEVRTVPDMLDAPLRWRKPRRIFVNSMSDLFHEDVPDSFIDQVFAVMVLAQQHTFQILTKRPKRMLEYMAAGGRAAEVFDRVRNSELGYWGGGEKLPPQTWPPPNVHLGVSVEDQATADERIPLLLQTPAAVRFISYEPALGPLDLGAVAWRCPECGRSMNESARADNLCHCVTSAGTAFAGVDWVIIGGESGSKARPFDLAWARSIIWQCEVAKVACFFKQCGANVFDSDLTASGRSETVRLIDRAGADPAEWPEDLRVRQFPGATT